MKSLLALTLTLLLSSTAFARIDCMMTDDAAEIQLCRSSSRRNCQEAATAAMEAYLRLQNPNVPTQIINVVEAKKWRTYQFYYTVGDREVAAIGAVGVKKTKTLKSCNIMSIE